MIRRTGPAPISTRLPIPQKPAEDGELLKLQGKIQTLEKTNHTLQEKASSLEQQAGARELAHANMQKDLTKALKRVEELESRPEPETPMANLPTELVLHVKEVAEEMRGEAVVTTGIWNEKEITLVLTGSADVFRKMLQKSKQAPKG